MPVIHQGTINSGFQRRLHNCKRHRLSLLGARTVIPRSCCGAQGSVTACFETTQFPFWASILKHRHVSRWATPGCSER